MSRIAVTGGGGFIGSWIANSLARSDHFVVVVDDFSGGNMRNLYPNDNDNIRVKVIDCTNEVKIEELFLENQFDYIYHLAANAREGASFFQPLSVVKRNSLAYTTVLMNAIRYGVKRIVLFSSISIYGNQEPPFDEIMSPKPIDIYGLEKAKMEEMTKILSMAHGIEYIIFRPFNVYGPGQALNDIYRNVFGIWMNKIMMGELLPIYGNGLQQRAFSYIEDSLPCYLKAIDPSIPSGTVANIGSSVPHTVQEAAYLTLEAMGMEKNYPIAHLPDRHQEVKSAYSNCEVARSIFGLEDKTDLRTGLQRMADWAWKEGPQPWREGDKLELVNNLTPMNWVK